MIKSAVSDLSLDDIVYGINSDLNNIMRIQLNSMLYRLSSGGDHSNKDCGIKYIIPEYIDAELDGSNTLYRIYLTKCLLTNVVDKDDDIVLYSMDKIVNKETPSDVKYLNLIIIKGSIFNTYTRYLMDTKDQQVTNLLQYLYNTADSFLSNIKLSDAINHHLEYGK